MSSESKENIINLLNKLEKLINMISLDHIDVNTKAMYKNSAKDIIETLYSLVLLNVELDEMENNEEYLLLKQLEGSLNTLTLDNIDINTKFSVKKSIKEKIASLRFLIIGESLTEENLIVEFSDNCPEDIRQIVLTSGFKERK